MLIASLNTWYSQNGAYATDMSVRQFRALSICTNMTGWVQSHALNTCGYTYTAVYLCTHMHVYVQVHTNCTQTAQGSTYVIC